MADTLDKDTATLRRTYSIAETAKLLGVGQSLIYKLVESGDIQSIRIGAKRILVPRDAIERLFTAAEE